VLARTKSRHSHSRVASASELTSVRSLPDMPAQRRWTECAFCMSLTVFGAQSRCSIELFEAEQLHMDPLRRLVCETHAHAEPTPARCNQRHVDATRRVVPATCTCRNSSLRILDDVPLSACRPRRSKASSNAIHALRTGHPNERAVLSGYAPVRFEATAS
jgi:hypothetical protein